MNYFSRLVQAIHNLDFKSLTDNLHNTPIKALRTSSNDLSRTCEKAQFQETGCRLFRLEIKRYHICEFEFFKLPGDMFSERLRDILNLTVMLVTWVRLEDGKGTCDSLI